MTTVHKPALMLYRRLLKTMMKVFDGDYEMFHKSRIDHCFRFLFLIRV